MCYCSCKLHATYLFAATQPEPLDLAKLWEVLSHLTFIEAMRDVRQTHHCWLLFHFTNLHSGKQTNYKHLKKYGKKTKQNKTKQKNNNNNNNLMYFGKLRTFRSVPLFSWFPLLWKKKLLGAKMSGFPSIFSLFLTFYPDFMLFFLVFSPWPLTPLIIVSWLSSALGSFILTQFDTPGLQPDSSCTYVHSKITMTFTLLNWF